MASRRRFQTCRNLALFTILASAASCTFQPEGSFVSTIEPPTGTGSAIALSDPSVPINLYWPTDFSFQVTPADRELYVADIYFNTLHITSLQSYTGLFFFRLDERGSPNGEKELRIVVTYQSNSQSLAGRAGVELFQLERIFRVVVDNTPLIPIAAPVVALEDGKMMIRWTPPTQPNFQKLTILRSYILSGNDRQVDTLRPARDASFFHDQSYVGGPVEYSVDMRFPGNYTHGGTTAFTCVPIQVSYDENSGKVSWTKPLNYGNNIKIQVNNSSIYPGSTEGSHDQPVLFGQPDAMVKVAVIATQPLNSYSPEVVVVKNLNRGLVSPTGRLSYLPSRNAFLFLNSGSPSILFDATTFVTTPTHITSAIAMVSQNGNYVYGWSGNFLSNGIGFHKISTSSTMSVVKNYDLKTFMSGAPGIDEPITITDNNLAGGNFYGTTARGAVLDMNTESTLWQGSTVTLLSADAEFMLRGKVVYKRGANTWNTIVGSIDNGVSLNAVYFRQEPAKNLLYATGFDDNFYIFNLDVPPDVNGMLQQVIHTLPPVSLATYGYRHDKHSNSLYTVTNGSEVTIYDADTFQQKKVIPFVYQPEYTQLENGFLFHANGYVYPNALD